MEKQPSVSSTGSLQRALTLKGPGPRRASNRSVTHQQKTDERPPPPASPSQNGVSKVRRGSDASKMNLSPANKAEQWRIIQSFQLAAAATDEAADGSPNVEAVVEEGLDWDELYTKKTPSTKQTKADVLLDAYGRNELPKPDLPSYFSLWIHAFYDIMMVILVIAMAVLYAVGDVVAATAILVIVLIATNIGAYTEFTSNKAASELGDLPGSSHVRSKNAPDAVQGWITLENSQLLPGMLIQLKTGDIVPADAIMLASTGDCYCTEAMLTGESEPVHKFLFHHEVDDDDEHASTKREAMTRLYMGTEFAGECVALVVETGERTQMGEIFRTMSEEDPEPSPLQKMIDRLIIVLALLSIFASVINVAVCIPTGRGVEPDPDDPQALICVLNSVALTVAAVPENLPVALVIALAAIIKKLAVQGVIVKSLPAGEELSRLNYVFSDKTGTLTKNEMTVRAVITLEGHVGLTDDFVPPEGSKPCAGAGDQLVLTDQIRVLAAKAQDDVRSNPTGDACKKAYPEHSSNNNLQFDRVLLETASSKTKMARMAVTINGTKYLVKVGSDWVLQGTTGQARPATDLSDWKNDCVEPFDKKICMDTIDRWAKDGYRVICIVAKPVQHIPEEIVQDEEGDFGDGFTFLGCIAIQDPPREDVAENVRIIRGAGVIVSMITGDNPVTGMSIARQIGLASDYTEEDESMCLINAFELFHNVEEEEAKREIHTRLNYSMTHKKGLIIGRVSPFQKKWFVEVAKSMGLVVAMTGDGANDAPGK